MQTGQCIIISFMFDPETFHHSSCHVFHQANLYPAFHFHFHSYITKTSLRKPDTVNICITWFWFEEIIFCKFSKYLSKLVEIQNRIRAKRRSDHGKEIFCKKYTSCIKPNLISTDLHTRHFHNTQEFRRSVQDILTGLCNRIRKLIQFTDSCAGKFRNRISASLCFRHFLWKFCNRACQTPADNITAYHTNQQRNQNCQFQHRKNLISKCIEIFLLYCTDQHPLFFWKWRIFVVQFQRICRYHVFLFAGIHFINISGKPVQRNVFTHCTFQCSFFWRYIYRFYIYSIWVQIFSCLSQNIRTCIIILKFRIWNHRLQISRKHFHTYDTIYCSIVQNQRNRICHHWTVISRQSIRCTCPASVIHCI